MANVTGQRKRRSGEAEERTRRSTRNSLRSRQNKFEFEFLVVSHLTGPELASLPKENNKIETFAKRKTQNKRKKNREEKKQVEKDTGQDTIQSKAGQICLSNLGWPMESGEKVFNV